LDDTISEKTYTDENALNCWHFSHAKKIELRLFCKFCFTS
jgi:hypothetical protein